MQPQAYPFDLKLLTKLWATFTTTGHLDEEQRKHLDPVVYRSWLRCYPRLDPLAPPRLNPLPPQALQTIQIKHFDLLAVARPILEDIYQFIEGSHAAVMITDSVACLLDMVGDADILSCLDAWQCKPGVFLTEGHMGTNAIALALHDAMPVQVVGPEHYLKQLHTTVTSAAPIHDVGGRIIGALAIVGPVEQAHSHSLAAVMAGARAISNQLQTDMYLQEANRRYSELQGVFEAISEGIIVWNMAGTVTHINTQAGHILGISPTSILGRSLYSLVKFPDLVQEAIEQHRELKDVEAILEVEGRSVPCVLSLRPMHEGAHPPSGFIATLRPIERVRALVHRLVGAQATLTLDSLLGESPLMRKVRRQARIAAQGRAPVLLRGEDGVGKNPLARAIHQESPRADGPFIAINCLAIPHELMLSEFLGYEGGAFSGALKEGRPSKFELADGGTLFLDEVESLTLEMQAALLQVIDTGEVMRLGSTRPIPVDVRIIAATSADLEKLVREGSFSAELYYRFGVFTIRLPSLREHPEDIPLLVERTLGRIQQQIGRPIRVSEEALELLKRYPWPGNVRELESTLERAALLVEGDVIRPEHLPAPLRQTRHWAITEEGVIPVLTIEEAEREAIIRAARACRGRVQCMVEALGISRTTLWRRLKALGIDIQKYR